MVLADFNVSLTASWQKPKNGTKVKSEPAINKNDMCLYWGIFGYKNTKRFTEPDILMITLSG